MIIYGASGHGKVIVSCINDANEEITGFFDDGLKVEEFMSYPFFGKYDESTKVDSKLIIAVGDNVIRRNLALKVTHQFGTVIHDTALVDRSVEIGEGSVIAHGAIIQVDTKVGVHCIVNTGASIDHDGLIGDYVHIAPQVTLCGSVSIGNDTMIGANSTVLPNIAIGENCIIGAGSVVIRDLPNNVVAFGNPAKIIRRNER